MPGLRYAVASGNWSDTAIWNGGVLPGAGDTVASNNFTIAIDQNVNVATLTNSAQSAFSIIPVMTSNTAPSGIASATNTDGSYFPFRAFDNNGSTEYRSSTIPSVGSPVALIYEFASSKIIIKYSFVSGAISTCPVDFTFDGWDGTSWVTLHTVVANAATTYTSPIFTNTTAYIRYRLNVTKTGSSFMYIYTLNMFEPLYSENAVSGGTFNLNSGVTLTCTSNMTAGPSTLITYAGSGTSTINSSLFGTTTTTGITSFLHSGTGTLNINGAIKVGSAANQNFTLNMTGTGTANITGTIGAGGGGASTSAAIRVANTCTVNIVGNVVSSEGTQAYSIWVVGGTNSPINITGDVWSQTLQLNVLANSSGTCILNITGNVYYVGTNIQSNVISITNNSSLYITGNVTSSPGQTPIALSGASYLNVVGTVTSTGTYAISSTSGSAINIFSGPFVCSTYGYIPINVYRMHWIPSTSSYFEFRDETTNGVLSPGAIAPATRLTSPATISDAPAPANVRFGTVYANGSLTGTCRIPAANAVAAGILVDNTTGSAVLTPANVWDVQTSTLTTSGSIGERLKNASTVQTTGEQLASIN